MEPPISETQLILKDLLLKVVPGEKRIERNDIKYGIGVKSDGNDIATIYFYKNAEGNEIEFALNDSLLAETSYEKPLLLKWLVRQKESYGNRKFNIHQLGSPVEWFRIGFETSGDALKFLESFRKERCKLNPQDRWRIPEENTPQDFEHEPPMKDKSLPSPESSDQNKNSTDLWNATVNRMVKTAIQTVFASNGQTSQKIIKNKDNAFDSEEDFICYVNELIRRQKNFCAISGLPLQPDDQCDDIEMQASLDRIDSNRHYEPGNLQVVCRFINRWKGADENTLFIRLLKALRQA